MSFLGWVSGIANDLDRPDGVAERVPEAPSFGAGARAREDEDALCG